MTKESGCSAIPPLGITGYLKTHGEKATKGASRLVRKVKGEDNLSSESVEISSDMFQN